MKERPIIFNDEMVRAILSGTKTMTRRPMKVRPVNIRQTPFTNSGLEDTHGKEIKSPFGAIGDRLWVRETSGLQVRRDALGGTGEFRVYRASAPKAVRYTTAEGKDVPVKWTPSIHMPRYACRILLEITDVRVERLQNITEDDARAEGVINGGCLSCGEPEPCGCDAPDPSAIEGFAHLWRDIYGDDGWNSNPWVWVIAFRCVATGIAAGASKGE
ncbi:hypothetical protein ACVQK1_17055 [Edwardsiella tarda]